VTPPPSESPPPGNGAEPAGLAKPNWKRLADTLREGMHQAAVKKLERSP
jgi:hypothetical protein